MKILSHRNTCYMCSRGYKKIADTFIVCVCVCAPRPGGVTKAYPQHHTERGSDWGVWNEWAFLNRHETCHWMGNATIASGLAASTASLSGVRTLASITYPTCGWNGGMNGANGLVWDSLGYPGKMVIKYRTLFAWHRAVPSRASGAMRWSVWGRWNMCNFGAKLQQNTWQRALARLMDRGTDRQVRKIAYLSGWLLNINCYTLL